MTEKTDLRAVEAELLQRLKALEPDKALDPDDDHPIFGAEAMLATASGLISRGEPIYFQCARAVGSASRSQRPWAFVMDGGQKNLTSFTISSPDTRR